MDICVIGAGYVGLVTGCSLAYLGNKVIIVEANKEKLSELKQSKVPFYEPGLSDLLGSVLKNGHLEFTDNIEKAVHASEIIFIAVGTPSLANGEPDLSQVVSAAQAIGGALDCGRRRFIVNKSTVPVGSGNWVGMLVEQGMEARQMVPARSAKTNAPCFSVVSNPEFLREGTAIADTLYPDRIVVGASDEPSAEVMRVLYSPIINQTFNPPAFAPRPSAQSQSVTFVVTDLASAEMIKYSANAFLAMKISFANEMALLCEKVGADIRQVTHGIGLDNRIGQRFLNAGIGWGGSCFGKDVHALIEIAKEYHCPTNLLEATISVNKNQRLHVITKLQEELKIIKGRVIGLMGLSFKPNTDDLRDAPSLTIAAQLLKMGASVKAYDPVSMKACAATQKDLKISYCSNLNELAQGADALLLVTEWDEFKKADWNEMGKLMKNRLLIDGRNFLTRETVTAHGFVYRGIGL